MVCLILPLQKNLTILELVFNIHKLYNGKIVNHKKNETYKTNKINIIPKEL